MDTLAVETYEHHKLGGDGKGTGMVKPEDMSLLQERLFEILAYFDEFCEVHGIRYSLASGTCLGAVREHDFIPWDDDLDVAVLREDFDKLFDLWEEYGDKENFSLYRTTEDFCAYVPIGIMRHNGTTFIRDFEMGLEDRNLGVKIDIEPLDEIPDDPKKRKKQRRCAFLYVLFMTQRKPRQARKKQYLNVGANFLLAVIRGKRLRYWIAKKMEPQIKKYNGTGCSKLAINGLGLGVLWNRKHITELTKMEFHGREFNVPADYDGYLTSRFTNSKYGNDYRQLPPPDKRVPLDEPAYYDLNMPYRDYLKTK